MSTPPIFRSNPRAHCGSRGARAAHGARLIILHVVVLQVLVDGTAAAEVDPGIYTDALEGVRKRVDGPDLKHPVQTMLRTGFAHEGITQTADEVGCDLIVMGTHGHSGLSRLLMGSVAENVLPKATCPVLVVKPAQRARAPTADRASKEMVSVF